MVTKKHTVAIMALPKQLPSFTYLLKKKKKRAVFPKFMLPSSGNAPNFRWKVGKINVEIMAGMVKVLKGLTFPFFLFSLLSVSFLSSPVKPEKGK